MSLVSPQSNCLGLGCMSGCCMLQVNKWRKGGDVDFQKEEGTVNNITSLHFFTGTRFQIALLEALVVCWLLASPTETPYFRMSCLLCPVSMLTTTNSDTALQVP